MGCVSNNITTRMQMRALFTCSTATDIALHTLAPRVADQMSWLHAWHFDGKCGYEVLGPGLQCTSGFLLFALCFSPWLHRLPHFPHLLQQRFMYILT